MSTMCSHNPMVPFLPNTDDDWHCVQASFGMMIKHFLPGSQYSWEDLDRITHRIGNGGTWWFPALVELEKLGLETIYISSFDFERYYREGESYLYETCSPEIADWYLKNSNLTAVRDLVPDFLAHSRHKKREATIEDLERLLDEGWLVGLDINAQVLAGSGGFISHMVVVFDHDEQSFALHDPGLPPFPHRQVSKELLLTAWGISKSLVATRGAARQTMART